MILLKKGPKFLEKKKNCSIFFFFGLQKNFQTAKMLPFLHREQPALQNICLPGSGSQILALTKRCLEGVLYLYGSCPWSQYSLCHSFLKVKRWALYPCSCTSIILYNYILNTVPKIQFMYFQKWNCAVSFPIPKFMFLWAIYIFPGSVCLFDCSIIGRPFLGIYKSLTDTWKW